ncbi:hypothetical protein H2202_010793 [Exophiala xenobiotica]|nr:hypothetical protein H2202_010793 [Exophiala xenobiotica]
MLYISQQLDNEYLPLATLVDELVELELTRLRSHRLEKSDMDHLIRGNEFFLTILRRVKDGDALIYRVVPMTVDDGEALCENPTATVPGKIMRVEVCEDQTAKPSFTLWYLFRQDNLTWLADEHLTNFGDLNEKVYFQVRQEGAQHGYILNIPAEIKISQWDVKWEAKWEKIWGRRTKSEIPVDADHSAMCKFETDQDVTFERVYKRIKRMKNQPRAHCERATHFEVPHLLSPVFTGRDNDLQHLTTSLATGLSSLRQHQRLYVIFGLGGSGKTQICLKYVQDQRERWLTYSDHTSIRFLTRYVKSDIGASSGSTPVRRRVSEVFHATALLFQVEENVDSVKRRLVHASDAWLLVFDDADDPRLQLTSYLPAGNRGDVIIITSRNPQCQHYSTVGSRQVGGLSLDDSLMLLGKVIYGTRTPSPDLGEESKVIVDVLGRLALAIVQAGAYIRETSCSFHDYLDIYERRQGNLLRYVPQHLGTDYQHSVYPTWQVSVDAIESYQDAVSRRTLSY